MAEMQLLVDLHLHADRQGPGGDEQTRLAIDLSGLKGRRALEIADVGCGTGASTLVLARELDAKVHAVDMLPEFIDMLESRAARAALSDRIVTHVESMDALSFPDGSLDAIWSEGAAYNVGFERAIRTWRRLLRQDGVLAVSELTWLTASRPRALEDHWLAQYPEVDTASAKLAVLERNGYTPLAYFVLPPQCWTDAYYGPMQRRFEEFLRTHGSSPEACRIVESERAEIALWERYHEHFGYGFYVARRTDPARGLRNRTS